MDDFEAAFSDYLDSQEGDEAEAALFTVMRNAFRAGWRAAGGPFSDPPGRLSPDQTKDHNVIHLDPTSER